MIRGLLLKLLAWVLSLAIYAHAQTAQQLMGGSQSITPGCVVSVPGHWTDTGLIAADDFDEAKELGGFTVTVNDIACVIHNVGPERLVFFMPIDAPLGDYSAIVNTPTGTKNVAMHVVEAAPTLHANPTGVSGYYFAIWVGHLPTIRHADVIRSPDAVIKLPEDPRRAVMVVLHASGINPAATLERELIFVRMIDFVETRVPVFIAWRPINGDLFESVWFILSSIPSGDYQIVLRVGTEFSDPENLTIPNDRYGFPPASSASAF